MNTRYSEADGSYLDWLLKKEHNELCGVVDNLAGRVAILEAINEWEIEREEIRRIARWNAWWNWPRRAWRKLRYKWWRLRHRWRLAALCRAAMKGARHE